MASMAFDGCGLRSQAAAAMACLLRNSWQTRAYSMLVKQLAVSSLCF